MGGLRVIWNLCPSYSKIEPFTLLLKRVSNELVKACTRLPHLFNDVLEYPRMCAEHIQVRTKVVLVNVGIPQ